MTFCKLFVIPLWFPAFWSFTALAPPSLADAWLLPFQSMFSVTWKMFCNNTHWKHLQQYFSLYVDDIGSWKQIEPNGEVLQNEFIYFRSGSKGCILGISAMNHIMMGYFFSILSIHPFYAYLFTKTIGLFIVKWIGKERSKTIQ